MKKFERLPVEQRKEEIQKAAMLLFLEKGFSNTTMENIIQNVSLSKGGVYRIYPNTTQILGDLMIAGMHLRNDYYEKCVQQASQVDLKFLVHMLVKSLILYPEYSKIYVEFLWEKQRNPILKKLYEEVCMKSTEDTIGLIQKYHMDSFFSEDFHLLKEISEWMNAAVLSLHVLDLKEYFLQHENEICDVICQMFIKKGE